MQTSRSSPAPRAGLPPFGRELLANYPRMHVMAARSDGRDTLRHKLRQFRRKLGKISPASPLDAVRHVRVGPA
jgi:hypothetical protein